jgi:hypothetical protein
MDPSLLRLMEELLEFLERRDSGDPNSPVPEATIRVRQLEDELARRLSAVPSRSGAELAVVDEGVVGIARHRDGGPVGAGRVGGRGRPAAAGVMDLQLGSGRRQRRGHERRPD